MPNETNVPLEKKFYEEINLFRGFAIFCIVFGHMSRCIVGWGGADISSGWNVIYRLQMAIFDGNTSFFVFISGFLFYQIFYKRGFDFNRFIKGKFQKVMMPWIVIVLCFSLYRISREGKFLDSNFIIYNCIIYWSFWYVPFIMTLFMMSSMHIKFIELSNKWRICVLILSSILSMCFGRHNTNPILSVIFWSSFYFFGIFCALHYDKIINATTNSRHFLYSILILFLGVVVSSNNMYEFHGYPTYVIKFADKIELMVVVKMLFCVYFIYLFSWIKDNAGSIIRITLEKLAKYSFSIFFLHQFVIYHLERHPHQAFFKGQNLFEVYLSMLCLTVITCIVCMLVAAVVKKLSGKYSRMIIGA